MFCHRRRKNEPRPKDVVSSPRRGHSFAHVGADGFAQPAAPSGALRMRHAPCGCCPPAAPEARGASFSRARRVGADDLTQPSGAPERYGCGTPLAGAVRPPRRRRGTPFRIHRRCHFCGDTATVAPRAYFFLSCQKKVCKKEALDAEIALTREKQVVTLYVFPLHFRSRNALTGDRRIRFLHRTI